MTRGGENVRSWRLTATASQIKALRPTTSTLPGDGVAARDADGLDTLTGSGSQKVRAPSGALPKT